MSKQALINQKTDELNLDVVVVSHMPRYAASGLVHRPDNMQTMWERQALAQTPTLPKYALDDPSLKKQRAEVTKLVDRVIAASGRRDVGYNKRFFRNLQRAGLTLVTISARSISRGIVAPVPVTRPVPCALAGTWYYPFPSAIVVDDGVSENFNLVQHTY